MNFEAPLKIRAGRGMSLRETLYGAAWGAKPGDKWHHPWWITPRWVPGSGQTGAKGKWCATVKPGLVNCVAPIVRTTVTEQASQGVDFGINPLTGKPFFSADVFAAGAAPAEAGTPNQEIDIPIYLGPVIALDFRAIGFDGDPSFSIPQFFLDRGAAPAPAAPSLDALISGETPQETPTPKNLRLVRACDIWVHQPRLGLTSTVELQPGIATGISNVTQTLSFNSPAQGDVLRLLEGNFAPAQSTIDPTQSDFTEATYDERLIGTVFLLSPPNAAQGSEPDGTWQPFVRHSEFWNLEYVPTAFQQLASDPGVPFIPPLAGGAAQLVINFLTASINDETQQALNILNAHSLAGTWFTATGGGSSAVFASAPVTQAKGVTGLDKAGRLAAQAEAAVSKRAVNLDPDFPYNAVAFTPGLLSSQ